MSLSMHIHSYPNVTGIDSEEENRILLPLEVYEGESTELMFWSHE